jgi:hypothetical protein
MKWVARMVRVANACKRSIAVVRLGVARGSCGSGAGIRLAQPVGGNEAHT